jgi:IS30 family transposase
MVSFDDRPEDAYDCRVPGAWEGDFIFGAHGKRAVITLVERHSCYAITLACPTAKTAAPPRRSRTPAPLAALMMPTGSRSRREA